MQEPASPEGEDIQDEDDGDDEPGDPSASAGEGDDPEDEEDGDSSTDPGDGLPGGSEAEDDETNLQAAAHLGGIEHVTLQAAEAIRKSKKLDPLAPILCVFDSVAAMIPKSVWEKDISDYSMNNTTALARVSSTTIKAVNQKAAEFNLMIVYLNQIRTKPSVVYVDPTTTPGGSSFEFYATISTHVGRM